MDSVQLSTLAALAGKWQSEADCGAGSADLRAALRECADTVRMLCEVRFEDCPHAAPHRYCAECPVSPCPIGLGEHAVAKPAKCDGNHGGPRCADPECWQDPAGAVIYVRMEAERLVKSALAVGVVLTIDTQPRQPLAMGNYDLLVQTREVRNG